MDERTLAVLVGNEFARDHYRDVDGNRANLGHRYGADSLMTSGGHCYHGRVEISAKFNSLPSEQSQHRIDSIDSQPTSDRGILVQVMGLKIFAQPGGEPQTCNFGETFYLMPTPEGGYYIKNDILYLGDTIPPQSQDMEGVSPS